MYKKRSHPILKLLYIPLFRFQVNHGGDRCSTECFYVVGNSFCWKLTWYPVVIKQLNVLLIPNSPLHSFLDHLPCLPYALPCVRPLGFFCCKHRTSRKKFGTKHSIKQRQSVSMQPPHLFGQHRLIKLDQILETQPSLRFVLT